LSFLEEDKKSLHLSDLGLGHLIKIFARVLAVLPFAFVLMIGCIRSNQGNVQDAKRNPVLGDSLSREQSLTGADFVVSGLQIGITFDSVLVHLGKPAGPRVESLPGTYEGYRYSGIVAWRDTIVNILCGVDIGDRSVPTARGLRVGDSLARALKLYGKPAWSGEGFNNVRTFGGLIPRGEDAWKYEMGDYHFVVLAKNAKIVKMLINRQLVMVTEDFKVGPAKLELSVDTVVAHLGKPDSISFADTSNSFSGLYYPGLLVWRSNVDKKIGAFEMLDSTYVTHRGLRVGESSERFGSLYGTDYEEVDEFWRVGVYDASFKDYDIEYGEYMVCYAKNDRITRILFYVGVDE
jgi:hypothetical protein